MLSCDVIRRIMPYLDQHTRIMCCQASKSLHSAIARAGCWRQVTVYKPDNHAQRFLQKVRPCSVKIVCSDVQRVSSFLECLVSHGVHVGIEQCHLFFGHVTFPDRHDLMAPISQFWNLQDLRIECIEVGQPACMVFSATGGRVFCRLKSLAIVEYSKPRKLEVYFDRALSQLTAVLLRVHTSDILAHLPTDQPLLQCLYESEVEQYEDARLGSCIVREFAADVYTQTALDNLMLSLQKARCLYRVTLTLHANVSLTSHIPAKHVTLRLAAPHLRLEIAHFVVRTLGGCSIEPTEHMHDEWGVRFFDVGSWSNFMWWMDRTEMHIGRNGQVVVDP